MRIQKILAYTLKALLLPFIFLPKSWTPIHLCSWYGKLGINVPPLVGKTSAPTVTTGTVGSITSTTAIVSGNNITSTGGANPGERGVVWSTVNVNPIPGVDTSANELGSFSTGTFSETLTTLPASSTIYFRAYAINSAGTGYGASSSFTTSTAPPSNGDFFQLM